MLLVVVVSALLSSAQDPRWPTECRVNGRTDWCAQPSEAMTHPAMRALVQRFCAQLVQKPASDVVPQPLHALDLAGRGVFATTTGSTDDGAEDALLGTADAFAWVTRAVGGNRDGQVEVRCPDVTPRSPSVRLQLDQLRSTTAAMTDTEGMHLDFAKLAKRSVSSLPHSLRLEVSLGFTTCDTADMDLDNLSPGVVFWCITEAYSQLGQGGYIASFRVVSRPPYFKPVQAG